MINAAIRATATPARIGHGERVGANCSTCTFGSWLVPGPIGGSGAGAPRLA